MVVGQLANGKGGEGFSTGGNYNYIKVYDKIQHSFVGDDILYYAICMVRSFYRRTTVDPRQVGVLRSLRMEFPELGLPNPA